MGSREPEGEGRRVLTLEGEVSGLCHKSGHKTLTSVAICGLSRPCQT